jgi:hypothetical protein
MSIFIVWRNIFGIYLCFSISSFSSSKYQRFLTFASYGLPLLWFLLTAIVEFTAPKCASYRPKFGERTEWKQENACFFTGNKSIPYKKSKK